MSWNLVTLPIVAALIGWGTNVIAIKMLFWPREPISLLGWTFVGVLPKRKLEIARSIGEVLNDEILPTHELIEAVNTPETRRRVTELIVSNMAGKVDRFLPRFLAEYAGDKIRQHLEELIYSEIENLFYQLGDTLSTELQENKVLGRLVEDKINSFDLFKLEELILKVAKNELRYIEVFGAVIGLVIGLVQVLILILF